MTTEFDKVFGDMMQPDYPSTCDQCGAEGTNASMKRHVCATSNESSALRAEEWRVFEHSRKRILDANGILVAEAQTEEQAEQIVTEHNAHRKLVEALRETRHTLEVLLTCDHCAACEYCNSHKIARFEITAIDAALAEAQQ